MPDFFVMLANENARGHSNIKNDNIKQLCHRPTGRSDLRIHSPFDKVQVVCFKNDDPVTVYLKSKSRQTRSRCTESYLRSDTNREDIPPTLPISGIRIISRFTIVHFGASKALFRHAMFRQCVEITFDTYLLCTLAYRQCIFPCPYDRFSCYGQSVANNQ